MKNYILLAAVVLAGVIPFSSRAVFMDEHIFLEIARSAQSNWLFPQDTPGMFFGTPLPDFSAHTHPPVGEYYLAAVHALLGGFQEVPFRLLYSIFPIIAGLAFYHLACRFTVEPFWAALLFVMSPAFFVMSPTLMMDMPMLAFLLAGLAFYFAHVQGKKGRLALAAVCFVLSAGTGYTALVPLGCLFIGLIASRRPWPELLSVAAAPAAVALWLGAMTYHFGAFPLAAVVRYYSEQATPPLHTLLATLSFLGGVALFPWTIHGTFRAAGVTVGFAALMSLAAPMPSTLYRMWFILLAAFGATLIYEFVRTAGKVIGSGKNNGEAVLILWVPATLVFFVLVGDMMNVRYILLSLPPLLLMLFRTATIRPLLVAIVPTAVLSVSLAYADSAFVNSYRTWVDSTVRPLQQQGFRVWSAAESGLRFNLERQGALPLTSSDIRPAGPDLIIREDLFRYSLSEPVATMLTVLRTFDLNNAFPLRTFNKTAQAGFHDSRLGIVPFVFSRAPFDIVEVAQVSPLALRLPLPENNPAWSPDGVIFRQSEDERLFPMKVPSGTALEYEVENGDGTARIVEEGIRLHKGASPIIVWKNFRLVPAQFAMEKN
jgi:4-amino-4-deoxy-L-arabinose transferase-like glycosyltransferase